MRKRNEMKSAVFGVLFCFTLLCISGCIPLIVGGAVGAVGGYAVSRDTIQGETDIAYDALWNAALSVSRIMGTIRSENISGGEIQVDIGKTKTWIRLIRVTQATTRLRVSCRKFHLPNLDLAQEIYIKIIGEAK